MTWACCLGCVNKMKLQHYLDKAIKNISELEGTEYECASYAINDLFEDLSSEIENLEYQANGMYNDTEDLRAEIKDLREENTDLRNDLSRAQYE